MRYVAFFGGICHVLAAVLAGVSGDYGPALAWTSAACWAMMFADSVKDC